MKVLLFLGLLVIYVKTIHRRISQFKRNDIQLKKYGIDINNNKFYLAINVNNITNNILYT